MNERDELIELIESNRRRIILAPEGESGVSVAFTSSEEQADAILAAGYRKSRTIETVEDANELPDRSAIITPGQIIFRKWDDYYAEGKHAWERGVDQILPAELLDEAAHLPATVLWEPK